ncbi:MAG TPA: hypothetical protein VKF62_10020, partial [Planctomycetota bacterium]|nr:hypothetical protein [Planctomycetota bacterium]
VTTTAATASTSVTLTAVWNAVTRTASLTVSPPAPATLPAPAQLTPTADAEFPPGQAITFDWSDVPGAASYTLAIDDNDAFPAPLVLDPTVTVSQFTTSTLPVLTMWWRVRAIDAAGNPGAWSTIRRFRVKV